MRLNTVIISAETIEQAIEKGLKDLALNDRKDALVKVIDSPTKGFFGRGAKLAKVEIAKTAERLELEAQRAAALEAEKKKKLEEELEKSIGEAIAAHKRITGISKYNSFPDDIDSVTEDLIQLTSYVNSRDITYAQSSALNSYNRKTWYYMWAMKSLGRCSSLQESVQEAKRSGLELALKYAQHRGYKKDPT